MQIDDFVGGHGESIKVVDLTDLLTLIVVEDVLINLWWHRLDEVSSFAFGPCAKINIF